MSARISISDALRQAVREVEALTGRKVVFFNLAEKAGGIGSMVQGYRRRDGNREFVWLDGHLPVVAREATAAHELGHIIQEAVRFPGAVVADEQRASAQSKRLAAGINNLVRDLNADRWALKHGFKVGEALADSALPRVVGAMQHDAGLAVVSQNNRLETDADLMAVDYAALRLRTQRYGLFDGLDRLWAAKWPESRRLGLKLWKSLSLRRFSSPAACRRALETILKVLNVSPDIITITG